MRKNENGSVVVVLVAIVALGILGFFGWRYFDSKNLASNSTIQDTQQPQDQENPQLQEENSTKKSIEFKELGINVTPPDNISDLTYSFRRGKTTDGKEMLIADLSTKTIEENDRNCGAKESPLGWLVRIDGEYPANPDIENSGGLLVKQFDMFHIDYSGPQATCTDNPEQQRFIESILANLDEKSWLIEKL